MNGPFRFRRRPTDTKAQSKCFASEGWCRPMKNLTDAPMRKRNESAALPIRFCKGLHGSSWHRLSLCAAEASGRTPITASHTESASAGKCASSLPVHQCTSTSASLSSACAASVVLIWADSSEPHRQSRRASSVQFLPVPASTRDEVIVSLWSCGLPQRCQGI